MITDKSEAPSSSLSDTVVRHITTVSRARRLRAAFRKSRASRRSLSKKLLLDSSMFIDVNNKVVIEKVENAPENKKKARVSLGTLFTIAAAGGVGFAASGMSSEASFLYAAGVAVTIKCLDLVIPQR